LGLVLKKEVMKHISITSKNGMVRQMWTSDQVADAILVILGACKVEMDENVWPFTDTVSREEAESNRTWRITEAGDGKRYLIQSEASPGNWMTLQIAESVAAGEAWIEGFRMRFTGMD
jgi:hypothetical protein